MLQPRSIQSTLGIRDKILSLDFILVISILLLGIISMFAMYSMWRIYTTQTVIY